MKGSTLDEAASIAGKRLDFLLETEKLKRVLRKTRPVGQSRFENSAEHSWQTTLAALLFMPEGLDAHKVLMMLLIHDLVEIDCGDVFVYDEAARADIAQAEQRAAERLFGMLDAPLGNELLALWREFEAAASAEARFAKAMDRVCPVIQNLNSDPNSWAENGISRDRVLAKNAQIDQANSALWALLKSGIDKADLPDT